MTSEGFSAAISACSKRRRATARALSKSVPVSGSSIPSRQPAGSRVGRDSVGSVSTFQILGTTYPPLIQWGVSCFLRFERCGFLFESGRSGIPKLAKSGFLLECGGSGHGARLKKVISGPMRKHFARCGYWEGAETLVTNGLYYFCISASEGSRIKNEKFRQHLLEFYIEHCVSDLASYPSRT